MFRARWELSPAKSDILFPGLDNQSSDKSEQLIPAQFPFVRWMQMNYNAGFARANNEGIRRSSGEMILLLNPDTIILDFKDIIDI